jgi:hypothetical protein
MVRPSLPSLCTLACFFVLSACQADEAVLHPGDDLPPEDSTLRWSNPSAWASGEVPRAGQTVVIPAGRTVELDVSPPPLGGLRVEGSLVFGRKDLELTADWILVPGTLRIGSEANPFTHRALITLTGPLDPEAAPGMGNRVLGVVPGGSLELWGERRVAWTRLEGTARAGADRITLARDVDWRVGERIVLAPSGFDPREAEDRAITAVS